MILPKKFNTFFPRSADSVSAERSQASINDANSVTENPRLKSVLRQRLSGRVDTLVTPSVANLTSLNKLSGDLPCQHFEIRVRFKQC